MNPLLLLIFIYTSALYATGFIDTSKDNPTWSDGNGTSYNQSVQFHAGSDPVPDCPNAGIFLKNNSARQETFKTVLTNGALKTYSINQNNVRCITNPLQSLTVYPYLPDLVPYQASGGLMQTTGEFDTVYPYLPDLVPYQTSEGLMQTTDGFDRATPIIDQLPPPPLSAQEIEQYSKTFSGIVDTNGLHYNLGLVTSDICKTITYTGYSLQCWKTMPNLVPWYSETPAQPIGSK